MQATLRRRAVRRAVGSVCQAVSTREFRLIGEQMLDLSPRGMLVRCENDNQPQLGDDVIVSFRAPGPEGPWLEAEATVARLVSGLRRADRGRCVGLHFTYFERSARHELLSRLAGLPPPIPQRQLRRIADRGSVAHAAESAVLVRPILVLQDEPVFELTRLRRAAAWPCAPRGTFSSG